jgi:two-component system, LytTR family, sensor kinase
LGLLAYFLFSRYKTKKQNELLLVELEQTQKTITAERKAAESELKALKSQMNPHFIFNALNSIQEQFMYGDKFKANDQMGNFTYLTRKILDVSGKKLITLATEVEILDKYLSLEKMRFGDEFVYTISLSDTLDEDYNQIPPMLIQPFAENSIKHGLLHRVGAKRLDIHFDLDEAEAYLICTITDNGVGRDKSALIKAKNPNQHQSFSTQSINERLAILSTDPSKELVQYTDLYDAQGEPIGTKVQVYIPL